MIGWSRWRERRRLAQLTKLAQQPGASADQETARADMRLSIPVFRPAAPGDVDIQFRELLRTRPLAGGKE
jgi:hypothetical protein